MELSDLSLQELLAFCKLIYRDDGNFKDNKTGVIRIVCGQARPFYARSRQKIIAVSDCRGICCACVLIIHKNAPDTLSVAFFEALPDCQDAVTMLLEYAEQYGAQNGCSKLVVALDGHINNGVAFPAVEGTPSFGESYCPQYYHSYFKAFQRVKFTSFYDEANQVQQRIAADLPKVARFAGRVTLEAADFGKGFAETMRRYTALNNELFADHKYYFHRDDREDYDLFNDMRPLLKRENLIFARCDGKDVGFVLWYPDFNELAAIGRGASILTFLKYKLLRQAPKTVKVVEIGVAAKYRRYGIILLLFDAAMKLTDQHTNRIVSSWISDENTKSKAITLRYTAQHHRDYYAYEKEL